MLDDKYSAQYLLYAAKVYMMGEKNFKVVSDKIAVEKHSSEWRNKQL